MKKFLMMLFLILSINALSSDIPFSYHREWLEVAEEKREKISNDNSDKKEIKHKKNKETEERMKYIVVDELCNEEREYYDLKEAKRDAFNVQGIVFRVNPDGEKETVCDYGEF